MLTEMCYKRFFDLKEVAEKKSVFLFGPRQTGKTSYIQNQLLKDNFIKLYWTLLDGRLRIKLASDIGLLRQELAIEVKASKNLSEKHTRGLKALMEEEIFSQFVIVCQEEYPRIIDGIKILPWKFFFEQLWNGELYHD